MFRRGLTPIFICSGVFALVAAATTPFIAPLYIYRAAIPYSDRKYWLTFYTAPSEQQIFAAVESRDSAAPRETKPKPKSTSFDPRTAIALFPFESGKDPGDTLADGTRINGVWLTEPTTRTHYPVALVAFTYFLCTFLFVGLLTPILLHLLRWTWYFLLARISELSRAVINPK